MYLNPRGEVLACCFNITHVLGDVRIQRLTDIWWGAAADRLRAAVSEGDLSSGCQLCAWQLAEGNDPPSRDYDQHDPPTDPLGWPQRLELAISNRCNLACTMCHGELSSRIRSQREGLAPLESPYDDRFFEDVALFLPHLTQLKILGGEPAVARSTLRVLDLVVATGATPAVHLTTNGAVLPGALLARMEQVPLHFAVSMDGLSAEVVERIRHGVVLADLLANLDRLQRYTEEQGTTLALTFSLQRGNWHELADFLCFAEDRGVRVWPNLVTSPFGASLQSLAPGALAEVVAGLESRDEELQGRLQANLAVWDQELARLRRQLARAGETRRPFATMRPADRAGPPGTPVAVGGPSGRARADTLVCDASETVLEASPGGFLGVGADVVEGRPALLALHRVEASLGATAHVVAEQQEPWGSSHRLELASPVGDLVAVAEVVVEPRADEGGLPDGAVWRGRWLEPPPG